jgi:hypothetical protein
MTFHTDFDMEGCMRLDKTSKDNFKNVIILKHDENF